MPKKSIICVAAAGIAALAVWGVIALAHEYEHSVDVFASAATGLLVMGQMCPDYVPLSDVLFTQGSNSLGDDNEDKVAKAVGAEMTRVAIRRGMKVKDADPSAFDPRVSKVVDDIFSQFMALYDNDAESACRGLGDIAVKNGFARRAVKP